MTNPIYPCLWYDGQARAAAEFYCSLFDNSKITSENPMVVRWELDGNEFMGLNGGPLFIPNPSISFFITCETHEEVDKIWKKLSVDAKIIMPLDKYDWSEYYGFLQDKFNISWQIYKGVPNEVNQKITPCLLFTDLQFGKANMAIQFYTSLFSNSKIDRISFYDENVYSQKEIVKHAQFTLNESVFMAMDGEGNHDFAFNEGLSFVIECDTQEQINYYWDNLISNGGNESQCGWCKDQFGVSWQVVPKILGKLMADPEKGQKVVAAFMKMKKFDIETLLNV
jgi:predicted 3-demethylubiquinone-9 3-methyltransferase (glyoxalase superfamily)